MLERRRIVRRALRLERRWKWALLGALLSVGSPLGAALLRLAQGHPPAGELRTYAIFYVYMALGTLLAFSAFGWTLGRWADSLAHERGSLRLANRRLRWLSNVDGLTGILNRRALDQRLLEEARRAHRAAQPFAVIMADIDRFKTVNDQHGHPAGDRVLRSVARRLRRAARSTDVVGRYGGEEFMLILPGTERDAAVQLAERLRTGIAEREIDGLRITASFGVAAAPAGSGGSPTALVADADAALYQAKNDGRNRVAVAPGAHPAAQPLREPVTS